MTVGIGVVAVVGGAGMLRGVAKMGGFGRWVMEFFRKAPGLDLVVAWFTTGPAVAGLTFESESVSDGKGLLL